MNTIATPISQNGVVTHNRTNDANLQAQGEKGAKFSEVDISQRGSRGADNGVSVTEKEPGEDRDIEVKSLKTRFLGHNINILV